MLITAAVMVRLWRELANANMRRSETAGAAALRPSHPGVIVTVSREHGSAGKRIGQLVAEKMGIPCYCKEMVAIAARDKAIKKIADAGSCVIVGRAADYVLRDMKEVVWIFIYAPEEYRVRKGMEMYGDTEDAWRRSIARSDAASCLFPLGYRA